MLLGIDYGSKIAGTTCLCFGTQSDNLSILSTKKNQDADQFILDFCKSVKPDIIGLDAPLSLPKGLLIHEGDYFYRKCDIETHAMSPMFLGGLTARAIKLKDQIVNELGVEVIEVYPKAQAVLLGEKLKLIYKSKNGEVEFLKALDCTFKYDQVMRWHEIDSILAWKTVFRYYQGMAKAYGDKSEGLIFV
jgi:predicted nuclease with RNAse H fold